MRLVWLSMAVVAWSAAPVHAALPALQPFAVRTTANGFAAVAVDRKKAKVTGFWPHIYAHLSPTQTTPNLMFDAYFGVKVDGNAAVWLSALPDPGAGTPFGMEGASGVVQDTRIANGVVLVTRTFAPMSLQQPGAVMLLEIKNPGSVARTVSVAVNGNVHLGPGEPPSADGEAIHPLGLDGLVESAAQTPHRILFRAIGAPPVAREATNPYQKWLSGQDFSSTASPAGNDRVAGMAWPAVTLPPQGATTVGWLMLYGENAGDAQLAAAADLWLAGRTAEGVRVDEMAEWTAWHALDQLPPTLGDPERLILQRNLATLRMAQVREPDPGPPGQNQTPHGQIVASLPPGIWRITWARDQAYAGVALAASGHLPEARAALDFVLHGQVGAYESFLGGAYLVTPVRYFGGGLEEVDADADGPNIEFDGLGLYLWQAARYLQASGDTAWLKQAWPSLRDQVAERLVALRDPTGLLGKDSSIWEVHWNGKQKHFAYSSILGVRGLCGAAELAAAAGEPGLVQKYRKVAVALRAAIAQHLVASDQVLRGNLEEPAGAALDTAVVEAFLDGQIDPAGPIAAATLKAWQKHLSAGGGPGFVRNDDGGEYDSAEWLFVDLRILRMLERMAGDTAALRARMIDVADQGGGVVPELLATAGQAAGQFAGAIPMVGFGAGAMALWLGGEGYGDDLSTCLAATAVADDPAVVEPVPDAVAAPDAVDAAGQAGLPDAPAAESAPTPDTDAWTESADGVTAAEPPVASAAEALPPAPPPRGCAAGSAAGGEVVGWAALGAIVARRRRGAT